MKKKKRTEVVVTKLSASARKARAKKLEYNQLKYKLVSKGLYEEYLAAKKKGEVGRGESLDLMRQMAGEGPVFKKEPKRAVVEAGESELINLLKRLAEIRAEAKVLTARIAERVQELLK